MTDISKKAIRYRLTQLIGDKTMKDVAIQCGICENALYNSAKHTISLTTLCKLCDGLGCTPNDLLGYGER